MGRPSMAWKMFSSTTILSFRVDKFVDVDDGKVVHTGITPLGLKKNDIVQDCTVLCRA